MHVSHPTLKFEINLSSFEYDAQNSFLNSKTLRKTLFTRSDCAVEIFFLLTESTY